MENGQEGSLGTQKNGSGPDPFIIYEFINNSSIYLLTCRLYIIDVLLPSGVYHERIFIYRQTRVLVLKRLRKGGVTVVL